METALQKAQKDMEKSKLDASANRMEPWLRAKSRYVDLGKIIPGLVERVDAVVKEINSKNATEASIQEKISAYRAYVSEFCKLADQIPRRNEG